MKPTISILIPDTNYLMDYPDVYEEKWRIAPVRILVCETVESELRGLTKDKNATRSALAQRALDTLDRYRSGAFAWEEFNKAMEGDADGKVSIGFVKRCTEYIPPLDPTNNDHQIIALAHLVSSANKDGFCAILSNDNELRNIATVQNLIAVARNKGERFHTDLETMYAWKQKEYAALERLQPDQEGRPRKRPNQAGLAFDRFIRKLYRKVQSLEYRTTIFLPSLQARIRFTIEVAQRVRNPEKQIILVFLKDRDTERYWAGEIRQKVGFSANEAIVFGDETNERLDKARIIFYQHEQICQHLPQHIARWTKLKKKVTAVVDGCDILEPVELAILLYECVQFIGLNHLPWNDNGARGRKMLDTVLYKPLAARLFFHRGGAGRLGPPVRVQPDRSRVRAKRKSGMGEGQSGILAAARADWREPWPL